MVKIKKFITVQVLQGWKATGKKEKKKKKEKKREGKKEGKKEKSNWNSSILLPVV